MRAQPNALSFHSTKELRRRVELLPSPPRWKSCEVAVPGGTTKGKTELLFRDGFECFSFLFGNPIFQGQLDLSPQRVSRKTGEEEDHGGEGGEGDTADGAAEVDCGREGDGEESSGQTTSTSKSDRIYSEIMTGDWAWTTQVRLQYYTFKHYTI